MENKLIKAYKEENIGDTSIQKYLRDLRHVANTKKLKSLDFLFDVDVVMGRLEKTVKNKPASLETMKGRLTGIMATIRVTDLGDIAEPYKKKHDELCKKLKAIDYLGEKNKKQKEYYISKEDIEKKTESLRVKAEEELGTFKNKQDYLLWSLYTKITPRRSLDYWLMDIVEDDVDWKTLPEERNYLILKDSLFIYNQHKNTRYAKEKGIVEKICFKDNHEFINIINDYIEMLPKSRNQNTRRPLLCYKNGIRWESEAYISENLKRISGKTRFGTNALRHIMAEHNSPPREELDKLSKMAAESGHSIKTHIIKYIQKTTKD
jgi:hypothetical protein